MKHIIPALIGGAVVALLVGGCASSASVESTYTAPNAGPITYKKILVVALTDDGGLRRSAEDAMAAQVVNAEVVRSYQAFENETQLKNRDVVAAKMREIGVDGIVTIRPLYNRQEVSSFTTGAYPYSYNSFYGYYGYGWGAAPFQTTTVDNVVGIETNIYNATKADLVWSGVTQSYNPSNMPALVVEVAKAVRGQLEKQGLLAPLPKK